MYGEHPLPVFQGGGERPRRAQALVGRKPAKQNPVNKTKIARRQHEALLKSQMAFFVKALENYKIYEAKLQWYEKNQHC